MIVYGFAASALPVWLLLAPRDYLSAFIKVGVVLALAAGILLVRPTIQMPALTRFVDGSGPVFAGAVFPFCFITIACGAISGFHALIASGTTPRLLMRETDARLVGYGSMLMESFVGVMAMVAACALDPGVYFAMNAPAGVVGANTAQAAATISGWGFPVDPATMEALAHERRRGDAVEPHRRRALAGRRHGAHLLRLDRRRAPARHLVPLRDHVRGAVHPDRARRRHARRPLHGAGDPRPRLEAARAAPARGRRRCSRAALIVAAWGYFLYRGVLDPLGGINTLWPLFGISNQLLASVALVVATTILMKSGHRRHSLGDAAAHRLAADGHAHGQLAEGLRRRPARSASWRRPARSSRRSTTGAVPPEKVADTRRVAFNNRLDAGVTLLFAGLVVLLIAEAAFEWFRILSGRKPAELHEAPYVRTRWLDGRRRARPRELAVTAAVLTRVAASLGRALAALWHGLRVWSGDAAYDAYVARSDEQTRLDRRAFYVESLQRRYRQPTRCC